MFDSLQGILKQLPDLALWVVPVVGGLAFGLAFMVGRRILSGPPPVQEAAPSMTPSGHFSRGMPRDRRASPRRKGNSVEVQIRFAEDQPPLQGWVFDRSIGGLGVIAEQAIVEGAVIRLRPRTASESMPWTEVTVRSCRQEGVTFELGCQFHRTPNWNMLLQFG